MKFKIFFIALLFVISIGLIVLAEIPKDKEVIKFEGKKGVVTFDHVKHSKLEGSTCKSCHHDMEEGKEVVSCHNCHGKNEDAPKAMKAFHKNCRDCHKKVKTEKAPTKCSECHIK